MTQARDDSGTPLELESQPLPTPFAWLARRAVAGQLAQIRDGLLTLSDGSWRQHFGRVTTGSPLQANVAVHRRGVYRRVLLGGTMGAAESYALGEWSADDLTALVRIFARNRTMAVQLDERLGRWWRPFHRLAHALRANTPRGSRQNIAAHYDLGNDFFEAFLDPTLSYSCAIYPEAESTLEDASRFKIDLLCRKLALRPGDELLEIGTGWGALAIHAAQVYGCSVTTTTISREQYRVARERVREAGLEDRVTVLDLDYRALPHLSRRFDKLVSVEMVEAVGEPFLKEFFDVCARLVKPGGLIALQSIVIADELFADYRRSVDFIQRYVFPGGFLPSRGLLEHLVAHVARARVVSVEDYSSHYARTLSEWRRALASRRTVLLARGYPERLLRLWDYYFSYCEGGFLERTIGLVQVVATAPVNSDAQERTPSGVPC